MLRNYLINNKVFIIAEAGVNHDGDIVRAKELIDVAAAAGVDAVKFQTWQPGECTGRYCFKVDYLEKSTVDAESRFELSNRLALPYDVFRELKEYCSQKNILFLSTPDGFASLDFLVDELRMPFVKIGSTEITHIEYMKAIANKQKPIILSTGLSTLGEVERCVVTIREINDQPLVLLHCTSEYPAPLAEVNLRAMTTMQQAFNLPVGLSDHTTGIEAAIAAVAIGATVIEKHFTINQSLPGPDHKASLSPEELVQMVQSIRATESLLGDGIKKPSPSELKNIGGIRRGIVALRPIPKGTRLTCDMLVAKRPFVGIEPEQTKILVGMIVNRDICVDEPIRWEDVK